MYLSKEFIEALGAADLSELELSHFVRELGAGKVAAGEDLSWEAFRAECGLEIVAAGAAAQSVAPRVSADTILSLSIISDTHNKLNPKLFPLLEGSDLILHAGDICHEEILSELELYAPLIAVLGNNDWPADFVSSPPLHYSAELRLDVPSSTRGTPLETLGTKQPCKTRINTGISFEMFHIPRMPETPLEELDLVVMGHTHVAQFKLIAKDEQVLPAALEQGRLFAVSHLAHDKVFVALDFRGLADSEFCLAINPGSPSRARGSYGHSLVRLILRISHKDAAPSRCELIGFRLYSF